MALSCGSADGSDLFDPVPPAGGEAGSGGAAAGGPSSGGTTASGGQGAAGSPATGGGPASGGSGGAGLGGAGEPFCEPGAANLCSCPDGALGSSICEATGLPGPCVCDDATACEAGQEQPCPCPGGNGSGVQRCDGGAFGPCTGCDTTVLPSGGCVAPQVCTSGPLGPVCTDPATGLPPFCPVSGDCSALGGSCTVTPFGAYCIAFCTL